MPIFPADDPTLSLDLRTRLRPALGYRSDYVQMVKRSEAEAGKTQTRDVWGRTRFVAEGLFTARQHDIALLLEFWRQNRAGTFDFFDFAETYTSGYAVGSGTGAATVFTLPAKEVVDELVYVNGVLSSTYTITRETGAVGQDQIVFDVAPTSGHAITASFYGRRHFVCEFPDVPQRTVTGLNVAQIALIIREVFV